VYLVRKVGRRICGLCTFKRSKRSEEDEGAVREVGGERVFGNAPGRSREVIVCVPCMPW
jgi:hypothetical protein